jgi:hypothetical protein
MSSPVRGSVEDEVDGSAELVDDELVVVVLEADVAVAALLDAEVTVVELLDDDVEVGAEGWVLVELEWCPEPEDPGEPEPPRGSVYCWSPADPPPPAMAAAGASIARAAIATTKPKIRRRLLTRRVLHSGRRGGSEPGGC